MKTEFETFGADHLAGCKPISEAERDVYIDQIGPPFFLKRRSCLDGPPAAGAS